MKEISSRRIETIEKYLNIKRQPAPYYLHKYKRFNFFSKRVFIGKGSPEEMVVAIQRNQHEVNRIGIDCSGFVCHIINSTQSITSVIKHPSSNPLTKLRFFLRPIEKISVRVLIHPINAAVVTDISQIRTWDLIHIGEKHIMIVYHREDNIVYYAHASQTKKKIIKSKIVITDPTVPLEEQRWSDTFCQKDYQNCPGSGVVRLRRDVFNQSKQKTFI